MRQQKQRDADEAAARMGGSDGELGRRGLAAGWMDKGAAAREGCR